MSGFCLLQEIWEHERLLPWIGTGGEEGGGDAESGDTQVLEQVREVASRPQVEGCLGQGSDFHPIVGRREAESRCRYGRVAGFTDGKIMVFFLIGSFLNNARSQ